MLEEGKIPVHQALLLIINSQTVIAYSFLPALTAPPANQDVWLAELLAWPFMMILSLPALALALRFPQEGLIKCCLSVLGKVGAAIGLLYVWLFLHIGATSLRYLGEFMTTVPMPETPILVFTLAIALVAASAVRNGLEVIGRLADAIVPLTLIGVLLVLVLVVNEADMKALAPILEKGWGPVALGSFITAARLNEQLVLAMLVPYLTEPKAVLKVAAQAAAGIVAVFVSITVFIIAVFGASQAATRAFPFFALVRMVNLGDVIERIEVIHMAIWVLGILLRTATYFYLSVLGLGQIFGLKTYRPIVFPLGGLMVALSIWSFGSLVDLLKFTSPQILVPYLLFFTCVLPLFLLFVSIVTAKKGLEKC